jgi:hypothetical protein
MSVDVVRLGMLVELFIMDERRLRPERHRPSFAKRPFAPIAIRGPDIAIDVKTPLVV